MNPKVSIIILTYNNLPLTINCLESIDKKSNYSNLEVIIVDNNSTDGTQDYLRQFHSDKKLIFNTYNRGFAAGNNQALEIATGDYIVFLNNDTVVVSNWVDKFIQHFKEDSKLGYLAPLTNFTGAYYQRLTINYENNLNLLDERYNSYLETITRKRIYANHFPLLCIMIKREVFEKIGFLDERFGTALFEDNDYSKRVDVAGYRLACATDLYIHHEGSASVNKLPNVQNLYEEGMKKFLEKWGTQDHYAVYELTEN